MDASNLQRNLSCHVRGTVVISSLVLLFFCMDQESYDELKDNYCCTLFDTTKFFLSPKIQHSETKAYKEMVFTKLDVMSYKLKNTVADYVHFIDMDIVLFLDPTKVVEEYI